MLCSECENKMEKIKVKVEDASKKVLSYQCPKCGNFKFEKESATEVINELNQKQRSPLMIHQKVVKLSHDRLGIYFNKHIINSLNLKPGEDIYVSVPDKKHIVLNIK